MSPLSDHLNPLHPFFYKPSFLFCVYLFRIYLPEHTSGKKITYGEI